MKAVFIKGGAAKGFEAVVVVRATQKERRFGLLLFTFDEPRRRNSIEEAEDS